MRYPWATIEPPQFERLAKQYLQDKYPENDWVLLPQSGDGNRDLQAVNVERIFDGKIESTQWVEAKHTKKGRKALSKGQLDPTIVSVLLDGSVRALMFLTNGRYTDSYILRAQKALCLRLQGRVYFIDGEILEAWLDQKPMIVSSYFSEMIPIDIPAVVPPPTIQCAELIGVSDYMDGHWEGRKALYQNEELILALVVSSQSDLAMKATVEATGLALEPRPDMPASFSVHVGRQIIPLPMRALQRHPDGKAVVSLWDDQGDRHCTATLHYRIDAEALRLDCSGQLRAAQDLHEVLRQHRDTPRPGCVSIVGASGSGKSHILQECLKTRSYQPMHFQLFNEPGQNARGLCRSLLFLSFGAAAELEGLASGGRFRSTDLPSELIRRLQNGMNGTTDAQEVLESLLARSHFSELFTLRSRGDAKVIIFDDVQKADELSRRVLNELMGQLAKSDNKTLIVLTKHPSYVDFDDVIRPLLIRDITVSPLTPSDVTAALCLYLQPEVVRILAPEIHRLVKTALELRYLASDLRAHTDLMALPTERAVDKVRERIVAASIPEIATRIRVANVEEAADLIVLLDAGVPEAFLVQKFGVTVVAKLLASELFDRRRERHGTATRIVASHDLLRTAYLQRRNVYSERLAEWIENLLKEEPHRRNDVLGHLCLCGEGWRQRYLSEALKARDDLLMETRFGAARSLSHTLYNLVRREDPARLGLSPEEHLSILYGYADCVNHTEGSGRAMLHFNEMIDAGKSYSTSLEATHFICHAQGELFNLRFWQHDVSGFQAQVEAFLKMYDNLPLELQTPRILEAKTIALNRLMMVEYLLDSTEKAENAFTKALEYSKKCGYEHDKANLLMDQAKSIMMADPAGALEKMERARAIYEVTNTQTRRLMVCRAQTAYLRSMLHGETIFTLEDRAQALRKEGFSQEYANCLLQISALHLVAGRCDDARKRLDEVGRQSNALDLAPRRSMLYHHLLGVAVALTEGRAAAAKAFERHEALTKAIGSTYRMIAQHNALLANGLRAAWAFEQLADAYWVEPRLW